MARLCGHHTHGGGRLRAAGHCSFRRSQGRAPTQDLTLGGDDQSERVDLDLADAHSSNGMRKDHVSPGSVACDEPARAPIPVQSSAGSATYAGADTRVSGAGCAPSRNDAPASTRAGSVRLPLRRRSNCRQSRSGSPQLGRSGGVSEPTLRMQCADAAHISVRPGSGELRGGLARHRSGRVNLTERQRGR